MLSLCLTYRLRRITLLVSLMASCVTMALGQTQFGSIAGIATDSSGASVPGVAIRATNEATSTGFSTVSTSAGDYLIDGILPGVYTVSATMAGFEAYRLTGIAVAAGQVSRADVHLRVGPNTQSVEVKSEVGAVETESAAVSDHALTTYLDKPGQIQVGDMAPSENIIMVLQGHDFGGGRNSPAYGDRSYDRRVTLDGAVIGFSNALGIIMPRDSIGEVQSSSLDADAEQQTADTSKMFTGKGTNALHGKMWYEERNAALEAVPWYYAGPRGPGLPEPVFGFSVGGPVYFPKVYNGRGKTFFFAAYNRFYEPYDLGEVSTVPNEAMIGGNLQGVGVTVIDPTTQQPFPNNIIPPSRISPIATAILNRFYPNIGNTPFGYGDISWQGPQSRIYWSQLYRVDHQFGSRNTLSVSYLYAHTPDKLGGEDFGEGDLPQPLVGYSNFLNTYNFVNVSDVQILSPTVVNEINLGTGLGPHITTVNTLNGVQVLQSVGMPVPSGAPNVSGMPDFEISGITHATVDYPQGFTDARAETIRDVVSWAKGRFTTRAGFEGVRNGTSSLSYGGVFGTYNFTGLFTGFGFGDFLLGLPATTSRSLPSGITESWQHELGWFGQESVRVNSRLNFNFGLRVQYNSPPTEKFGRYYNFDPRTGDLVLPNQHSLSEIVPGLSPELLAHIVQASAAGFPAQLVNSHVTFDPRAGIAYQLSNNLVFRVGYGLYHNLLANGAPQGGNLYSGGSASATNEDVCAGASCAPEFSLANPFPSTGVNVVSGMAINGVNPNLRVPQTHQWNATLERQLRGGVTVRASYVGAKSTYLPFQRDLNLPPASTIPLTPQRLTYPEYYSAIYADSGGNQTYHVLDLGYEKYFGYGLSMRGGFEWQKCLSDVSEGGAEFQWGSVGPLGPVIEDPYDRSRDRGNCEMMQTRDFRTFFVYDLPIGKGKHFLGNPTGLAARAANGVFGGWTVSGFFHTRSGVWYSPIWSGFDAANTGETLIRPDRVCSGRLAHRDANHVFDPSCFVQPPDGRYGNSGRGILEDLPMWRLDPGIWKDFTFSNNERMPRLRVAMTTLNIFNHPVRVSDGTGPFIINGNPAVAIADDMGYDNGSTAELGDARAVRFDLQIVF